MTIGGLIVAALRSMWWQGPSPIVESSKAIFPPSLTATADLVYPYSETISFVTLPPP